jgi:arylsulfatase A
MSMFPVKKRLLFFVLLFSCLNILYAQTKPNIVYILADDLGYGDVSCFNKNSKLHTTNIDQLAAEGMRFTDAHSNSAVCTPTRYGILTGRYAWRSSLQSGVSWSYDKPLISQNRMTVASLLKANGYHTACIGKWHLGLDWQTDNNGVVDFFKPIKEGPNQIGFDYFFGISASLDIPPYVYIENGKITATRIDSIHGTTGKGFWRPGPIGNDFKHDEVLPTFTDKAVNYIKQQSKTNQPFFLYLALPSPHTPILPTKEYLGKSGTNEYGDFVLMTDDMVGKVLKAIKESGLEENTIVVFTSDNGCSLAANIQELAKHGHNPSYIFRGAKADIFDGGHRVPFIVKWPGEVKPNSVTNSTICLTDFMATCAAILHKPIPVNAGEDSYNLLPLLLQNKQDKFQRTSTIHHSIDGCFAIREGKWKLEFCRGSGGWSNPTEKKAEKEKLPVLQLYNLDTDIAETKNVADKYPEIVKRLSAKMKKIIKDGRSTAGAPQKNDVPVVLMK